jgi:hypothetical protein
MIVWPPVDTPALNLEPLGGKPCTGSANRNRYYDYSKQDQYEQRQIRIATHGSRQFACVFLQFAVQKTGAGVRVCHLFKFKEMSKIGGISVSESEFLAQETLISISPTFRHPILKFISVMAFSTREIFVIITRASSGHLSPMFQFRFQYG